MDGAHIKGTAGLGAALQRHGFLAQQRENQFGKADGLFQMRIARQHKAIDAKRLIFGQPFGHLFGAVDQHRHGQPPIKIGWHSRG